MEKLYTVEDVARMTGLTSRTIRNYLADGRLRGRKIGSQWRFTENDVEALFSQRADSAAAESASDDLVSEFLIHQPRSGLTTCSIIDYPTASADAAGMLQQMLSDHISAVCPNGEVSFCYEYIDSVNVARFIFSGPADLVSKLVKIVRKKG